MRSSPILVMAACVALFVVESYGQSGGYQPQPRSVTIRPSWSNDLQSAKNSVGREPAPVLALFVEDRQATSRIQVKVDARDSSRSEVSTWKSMGFARLVVSRKALKVAQQKKEGASANAALAVKYGVKSVPGGVMLDNYGNLLFAVAPSKLQSTGGILKVVKKARQEIDRIVEEVETSYRAGQKALRSGNTTAARRSFEKAAKYVGYALAEKSRAEIEKLPKA